MSAVQVLVATMHQTDFSLLDRMHIGTDAVVINQCDKNSYAEFDYRGHTVRWIDTVQRGLSRSRNMALSYASGDICLLADDDIRYVDAYENLVLSAFSEEERCDIVVFNTYVENSNNASLRKPIKQSREAPRHAYYGSVRLAFRLNSIKKHGLHFNDMIGAGTKYGSGEESLFLRECRRKKLRVFLNNAYIASVDYSNSCWFKGFNEKYYFDKGVFLAAAYGRQARLYKLYFLMQSRKISDLSMKKVNECLDAGIREFMSI